MLVPSATVFFSSGCIMILELVASRLVARDLGSSLYTWTSIIGVVLTGIAVGNYLGGRIADRYHARRALAVLFGLSSAACVAIVVVNNVVGGWMWLWRLSWPAHVFIHVSLVFLVPSTLLGTIAPVAAKMALDRGLATGRTIGDIYAWGAAGSIAGTFLAGFYLIAAFGSVTIIWGIGAALLAMAILYWLSCWVLYVWAMIFGADHDGHGPRRLGRGGGDRAFLRQPAIRTSSTRMKRHTAMWRCGRFPSGPPTGVHAGQAHAQRSRHGRRDQPAILLHEDLRGTDARPEQGQAGLVHDGHRRRGYAFPQYLKATWPNSRVEVVEIDPGVTEAAMAASGSTGTPRSGRSTSTRGTTWTSSCWEARQGAGGTLRLHLRGRHQRLLRAVSVGDAGIQREDRPPAFR